MAQWRRHRRPGPPPGAALPPVAPFPLTPSRPCSHHTPLHVSHPSVSPHVACNCDQARRLSGSDPALLLTYQRGLACGMWSMPELVLPLQAAQANWQQLQVPDEALSSLVAMGFSTAQVHPS